jgi:hypothetical protein
MRPFRLALAVALALGLSVQAGENKYLGAIVVSGASLTNLTTAAPFAIPPGAKFTVNCTAAVNMLVDNLSTSTSGATKGLPIPASTNFPTSCGRALGAVNNSPSCVVAITGTATCDAWLRDGNE